MNRDVKADRPALPRRKRILFTLIAVAAVLALLEGAARLWLALSPRRIEVEAVTGVTDTRWMGLLESDTVAVDGTAAELYAPDDALFWTLRPGTIVDLDNAVYRTRGEPLRWHVEINASGHRGPFYPEGPERPVVLALGDSCTFGFRVDEDQTYPSQLQHMLRAAGFPEAVVVNRGVPGYTSFQGRRLLDSLLETHRPDAVLLSFGANDHELDRYSDLEKAERFSGQRFALSRTLDRLALARLLRGSRKLERALPGEPSERSRQVRRVSPGQFRENMVAMIDAAQAAGAQVILLDLVFVEPDLGASIAALAAERELPSIDGRKLLHDALLDLTEGRRFGGERERIERFWNEEVETYRPLYFPESFYRDLFNDPVWNGLLRYFLVEPVHPNELGHRVIAEALAELLAEGLADH